MSNLTNLEKMPLIKLCNTIKEIKKSYDANSDSFQDTIHNQYLIETNERATLDQFLLVAHMLDKKLSLLVDQAGLIEDHFLK